MEDERVRVDAFPRACGGGMKLGGRRADRVADWLREGQAQVGGGRDVISRCRRDEGDGSACSREPADTRGIAGALPPAWSGSYPDCPGGRSGGNGDVSTACGVPPSGVLDDCNRLVEADLHARAGRRQPAVRDMRDRSLDRQPLAALVAERPPDPAWAFDDDVNRDCLARRHQCRRSEQLAGTVEGDWLTAGAAGSGAYELAGKRLELDTRECNGIALQRRARPEADRNRNGDGNHGKEPDSRQQHTRRRGRRATRGLDRFDHGPSIGTRRESVQTPAESAASGLAPASVPAMSSVDTMPTGSP